VTFDPNRLAEHDLRPLGVLLLDAGYRTRTLAESLKLADAEALLADAARNSFIHCDSLGTSPPAILGRLFLLCAPVPVPIFGKLPGSLMQALYEYGLVQIDADGRHVVGKVSITEVDGYYFLADRLFENRFGDICVTISADICMPPHASSFELSKAIARVPCGLKLLDIGCGSGCLSLPLAGSADLVTGIDISSRAVAFARANASLNGARARFAHADWEQFDSQEHYDQVFFNSPDAGEAFRFVNNGIPRFLRRSGRAQVWLNCEVLAEDGDIQGTVHRMSAIEQQFDVRILVNDGSPFSLNREALAQGKRPPRTLLVEHSSEWREYVDSLRSRDVVEVASIVLDVTGHDGPYSQRGEPGSEAVHAVGRGLPVTGG
jgi:SAM-dependent methyltransferase